MESWTLVGDDWQLTRGAGNAATTWPNAKGIVAQLVPNSSENANKPGRLVNASPHR